MISFRDKMTKLMFGLLFIQASLITLFLHAQANLFLGNEILEFVELWVMYVLFFIEILINTGVIYSRYLQHSGT